MNEKLSDHITLKEAISSPEAIRLGINNNPDSQQVKNMAELATNVFEPLRSGLGNQPIRISSFFRCEELNRKIGGAKNSQHVALNGSAMDIDNESPSNLEIFNYIKDNLEFDQLINEFPVNGQPSWIHVSWNTGQNRNAVLVSEKVNGKTVYRNA